MTGNLWILIALGSGLLTAAQIINIRQHCLRRARPDHRSVRTPCNVGGKGEWPSLPERPDAQGRHRRAVRASAARDPVAAGCGGLIQTRTQLLVR